MGKKRLKTSCVFSLKVLAHNVLYRVRTPYKRRDYGNSIDHYRRVVVGWWWGLGIFSLAPVTPRGANAITQPGFATKSRPNKRRRKFRRIYDETSRDPWPARQSLQFGRRPYVVEQSTTD